MGEHSSNPKPDSTQVNKELPKGQAPASASTSDLTGDLNKFLSAWNGMKSEDASSNASSRVQSPMLARFLSDSEAPFTGLPRTGRWEQNIALHGGRTTTVQATQGSASEADQHLEKDPNKRNDRKERKEREAGLEKQYVKK
ncbi:hypothetical protein AK830_g1229 [Neonectria ditissima]|uniref:Uncharacterized protein n=1 Tax=Neonectria ditissima TaxID=78410 RepID=A0A0P7BXB3_9HYPO|nr:hypothetical protein AK830_g1229 [Neonectria ditissima]